MAKERHPESGTFAMPSPDRFGPFVCLRPCGLAFAFRRYSIHFCRSFLRPTGELGPASGLWGISGPPKPSKQDWASSPYIFASPMGGFLGTVREELVTGLRGRSSPRKGAHASSVSVFRLSARARSYFFRWVLLAGYGGLRSPLWVWRKPSLIPVRLASRVSSLCIALRNSLIIAG